MVFDNYLNYSFSITKSISKSIDQYSVKHQDGKPSGPKVVWMAVMVKWWSRKILSRSRLVVIEYLSPINIKSNLAINVYQLICYCCLSKPTWKEVSKWHMASYLWFPSKLEQKILLFWIMFYLLWLIKCTNINEYKVFVWNCNI